MSGGDFNMSLLHRVAFVLFGKQIGNESELPKPVALTADRELMVAARLTGGEDSEEWEPTLGTIMSGALTTHYTATRRTKIYVELVNSLNFDGATALVVYKVNAADVEKVIIPSVTPVPLGVGIRVGHFYLNPGGTIAGSCSPPFSVTIHPIPSRVGS